MNRALLLPWLALGACADPTLYQNLPTGVLHDRLGEACPGQVAGAYGTTAAYLPAWGLLTDGELLYLLVDVDDVTELVVLDPSDPRAVRQLARTELPGVGWLTAGAVSDGTLLAAWGDRREDELVSVAIGEPTAPRELDRISLGHAAEPGAIALHDTTAYLDVVGVASLDLTHPDRLRARATPGLPALQTPAIDGDTLVTGGWEGPFAATCWIDSFDLAHQPPLAGPRLPTTACATSGLLVDDGRVFGIGYVEDEPAVVTAAIDDPASVVEVKLADRGLTRANDLVRWDGGAIAVVGRRSGVGQLLAIDAQGQVVGSWSPGPAFVESAVAVGDLVWAIASYEDGRFHGLAALDFSGCLP